MTIRMVPAALVAALVFAFPAMAQQGGGGPNSIQQQLANLEEEVDKLKQALAEEQAARMAADTALREALLNEEGARMAADRRLEIRIEELAADVARVVRDIGALREDVIGLRGQIVPDLAAFVSVIDLFRDVDGDGVDEAVPTVRFEAVNVQIVDGTGSTKNFVTRPCSVAGTCPDGAVSVQQVTSGLGNLIVGYDEPGSGPHCSEGTFLTMAECLAADEMWGTVTKNGSHNVVIGDQHVYTKGPGLVAGSINVINARGGSTVSGGSKNSASGPGSSISGGLINTAIGGSASVSGGSLNVASGSESSVGGGAGNEASGQLSSVSGGAGNEARGLSSSVNGGLENLASDIESTVSGGFRRSTIGQRSWVAGGLSQTN